MKQKIVLASSSPRRKALLKKAGVRFTAVEHKAGEGLRAGISPRRLVEMLAEKKARSVAKRMRDCVVIGADTLVVCNGKRLGKPKDAKHALGMLKRISGKRLGVYSGVAVVDSETGSMCVCSEKTIVVMKRMNEAEIRAYVRTGEPIGKAGAIAVQGKGAKYILRMQGSRSNVVGLPMACLRKGLGKFGVKLKWRKE